jgi:hypothetical protein
MGSWELSTDPARLAFSLLFSVAGSFLCVFGFKARQMSYILAGAALLACAVAMGNLIALICMSTLLGILPWVMPGR